MRNKKLEFERENIMKKYLGILCPLILILSLTACGTDFDGSRTGNNNEFAAADGADAGRTRTERPDYQGTENAARRIADLEREVKQREQSREHSSLKERLEENKRIIAERERENARCQNHDRGMSR